MPLRHLIGLAASGTLMASTAQLLAASYRHTEPGSWNIAVELVANQCCPPSLLEEFSYDEDLSRGVAKNPATPAAVLERLGKHTRACWDHLASNPSTPPETLRDIYEKTRINRRRVAANPNTPADVLDQMVGAARITKFVAIALAQNLAVTDAVLQQLADHAEIPLEAAEIVRHRQAARRGGTR